MKNFTTLEKTLTVLINPTRNVFVLLAKYKQVMQDKVLYVKLLVSSHDETAVLFHVHTIKFCWILDLIFNISQMNLNNRKKNKKDFLIGFDCKTIR